MYPPVLCTQPLGRAVVPLVYMRNSGASAGMDTGSTVLPFCSVSSSSTQKSRPLTHSAFDEFCPTWRRPHHHLVDLVTELCRSRERFVGLDLVIEQVAVPVVSV